MDDNVPMRLYAALVPPPDVADDLAAVVRSVARDDAQLTAVPAELIHLPLGNFGNVGLTDRTALQNALQEELAGWPAMNLRFKGGAALVKEGDDSVWAHLDGDVDRLVALGAVVPKVVQRLGFLIDRRVFRPSVRIGRITPHTRVDFLERLLQRLDGYRGPAWTAHNVSLLRHHVGEPTELDIMRDVRLAGSQSSSV
jgi:RNA 2',3'-cyclic 3'-phosphodiesterase